VHKKVKLVKLVKKKKKNIGLKVGHKPECGSSMLLVLDGSWTLSIQLFFLTSAQPTALKSRKKHPKSCLDRSTTYGTSSRTLYSTVIGV
jgi:hypothetical protein